MSEGKDQKVTLKISPDSHDWLEREQLKIKERERRKPTQDGVFQRMRAAYERLHDGHPAPEAPKDAHPDIPAELRSAVAKLVKILQSGDQISIMAITTHLDFAVDRLRPVKPDQKSPQPLPSGR